MAIRTTEKDSFLALNDGEGRPSVHRENNNYVCLHHCCEDGKCTLLRLKFDSARKFIANMRHNALQREIEHEVRETTDYKAENAASNTEEQRKISTDSLPCTHRFV